MKLGAKPAQASFHCLANMLRTAVHADYPITIEASARFRGLLAGGAAR